MSTEYINAHAHLRWRCRVGHEWTASANSVKMFGSWCPECGNGAEDQVRAIFDTVCQRPFTKAWPEWMRSPTGSPLELDGLHEKSGFAFECNGRQHYEFVPYFHETRDRFVEQQMRDQLKASLCANQKVILIEIPLDKRADISVAIETVERVCEDKCIPIETNPDFRRMLGSTAPTPKQIYLNLGAGDEIITPAPKNNKPDSPSAPQKPKHRLLNGLDMNTTESPPLATSRSMTRRESVWKACDELAATGVKPALSKIREKHRGGSDTDVQNDIHAWFAEVFKRHLALSEGTGLPDDIAAMMRSLWEAARASAEGMLAGDREALAEKEAQLIESNQAALEAAQSAQLQLQQALTDLSVEREKSAGLADALSESRARALESESQLRLERERSANLAADMASAAKRHAEETAAMRAAAAQEAALMRSAHADELSIARAELLERSERYSKELALSEDRMRAVEKRLLMETDAVRHSVAEWKLKAQAERDAGEVKVAAVRSQSEALLGQVAGLRAQLAASSEALAESRSAAAKAQEELAQIALAMANRGPDPSP